MIKTKHKKTEINKIFGISSGIWPYFVGVIFFVITLILAPTYFPSVFKKPRIETKSKKYNFYSPENDNPRILLAGDGGKIQGYVVEAMKAIVQKSKGGIPILYLGDNIYPNGIPSKEEDEEEWKIAYKRLMHQINPLKELTSKIFFVPGNHDWDYHQEDGWEAMKRQTKLVEDSLGKGHMIPANGCPGPYKLMLFEDLQVLAFDSQWWLHEYSKPSKKEDGCDTFTREMVLEKLDKILSETPEWVTTIFVNHHPLVSYGNHGVGNDCRADLGCPEYSEMRDKLFSILDKYKPLICASGHDHNLQIIKDHPGCKYYLVSGATSNYTSVRNKSGRGLDYFIDSLGFLLLERIQKGKWEVRVISVVPGNWFDSASSQEVHSIELN